MRSLGALGTRPFIDARGINTHRRIVGISGSADRDLPILWTPDLGIRRLPDLGGGRGHATDLNEFGQIVGTTNSARGAIRATLWTPIAGPLVVAPSEEGATPESAALSGEAR